MNDFNFAPQGWECPKCKRVYSPTTPMCWYCPTNTATSGTSTGAGLMTGTTTATVSGTHNFVEPKLPKGEKISKSTKCAICGVQKHLHPIITLL